MGAVKLDRNVSDKALMALYEARGGKQPDFFGVFKNDLWLKRRKTHC